MAVNFLHHNIVRFPPKNKSIGSYVIKCKGSFTLNESESNGYFYSPQTKFAKVIFLQVSVCPRGGACVTGHVWTHAHPQPLGTHAPRACTPRAHMPLPLGTHAPGGYYEMRSMSRRYASYWNAFLFKKILSLVNVNIKLDSLWTNLEANKTRMVEFSTISIVITDWDIAIGNQTENWKES